MNNRIKLLMVFSLAFCLFSCGKDDDGETLTAPVANFNIENNNCTFPCDVSFTSTTIGENVTLQWDFGDGGSSLEEAPTHTYTDKGTYTVTLNAQNDAGFNQIKKDVTILEN